MITPDDVKELAERCAISNQKALVETSAYLYEILAAWNADIEMLSTAGRLIDGLQAQINSYLRLLENSDVD
jgi:hypothetical protein